MVPKSTQPQTLASIYSTCLATHAAAAAADLPTPTWGWEMADQLLHLLHAAQASSSVHAAFTAAFTEGGIFINHLLDSLVIMQQVLKVHLGHLVSKWDNTHLQHMLQHNRTAAAANAAAAGPPTPPI